MIDPKNLKQKSNNNKNNNITNNVSTSTINEDSESGSSSNKYLDTSVTIITSCSCCSNKSSSASSSSSLDHGWAWVIVFASFMILFIGDGIAYTFGLFFIHISDEYTSSGKACVSWIASIMIAITHAVGPLGSVLVHKYGCRRVSIAGSILATIGYGASYFSTDIPTLYITLGVVGGLGLGLMYLPCVVIVPQYFISKRSLANGIAVAGSGLGTFTFEWIFSILLTNFSWRQGLAISSGIIASTIFFAMLYRPGPVQENSSSSTTSSSSCKAIEATTTDSCSKILQSKDSSSVCSNIIDLSLLKNPIFLIFSFCDLFTSIGFQIPFVYLPEIETNKDIDNSGRSTLLGVIAISSIISKLISGCLGDQKYLNRFYMYNFSLILAGIGTIASPHLTSSILCLRAYAAVYGGCMGTYVSLKSIILVDLLGIENLVNATGLMLLIQSIGFVMGPPIVGKLYDIYGDYKSGFYFSGTTILVSGICLLTIPIINKLRLIRLRRLRNLNSNITTVSVVSFKNQLSIENENNN